MDQLSHSALVAFDEPTIKALVKAGGPSIGQAHILCMSVQHGLFAHVGEWPRELQLSWHDEEGERQKGMDHLVLVQRYFQPAQPPTTQAEYDRALYGILGVWGQWSTNVSREMMLKGMAFRTAPLFETHAGRQVIQRVAKELRSKTSSFAMLQSPVFIRCINRLVWMARCSFAVSRYDHGDGYTISFDPRHLGHN